MNIPSDQVLPFISFEGIDFSGKTTQIGILAKKIEQKGFQVNILRDPGGTQISEQIRKILLDPSNTNLGSRTEILLYEAARAQVTKELILPALDKGHFVIIDRYFDSTTAYQGFGRGLPMDIVATLNLFASYGLKPTLTFFLDIPVEIFLTRSRKTQRDRLEQNDIQFFEKVRNGFLQIAKKEPERFIVLDGSQTVEKIAESIWKKLVTTFAPYFKEEI